MNDKVYPTMAIRSQAETIELLEKENKKIQEQLAKEKEKISKVRELIEKGSYKDLFNIKSIDELLNILGKDIDVTTKRGTNEYK